MRKREFIRASGTKGFRKSELEVIVRSPQGKQKSVVHAEVSRLSPDLRRKESERYATLCTFGRHGRRKLTFDVVKGTGSLTIAMGFHFDFDVFDLDLIAKYYAFLRCVGGHIIPIIPNSSIIEKGNISEFDISRIKVLQALVPYYEKQFREKIRLKRISFKRHLKAHHEKRHRKRKG
jgi:hypothetical protein